MPEKAERAFLLLLSLFITALLLTNIVAAKYCEVGPLTFTAGVVTYPFTFLLTDIISECYGKRRAQWTVVLGFLVSVLMVLLVALVRVLPIHTSSPVTQLTFDQVFGFTPGIVLGSLVAYSVAQWADIQLFEGLRRRTQGRHLWLRNNVATLVSQLLDTVVFAGVAWVVWPWLDWTGSSQPASAEVWWQIMVVEYGLKVLFALCDTPLVYLGVHLLRRWGRAGREEGA